MAAARLRSVVPRRLISFLAPVAIGAFVAAAMPRTLSLSWESFAEAWRARGESAADACRRVRGMDYWNGIEAIRKEIPPDGTFLLAWTSDEGTDVFTRFDLAPRRAAFLGRLLRGSQGWVAPSRPPDAPLWVVIANPLGQAPRLLGTDAFFGAADSFRRGREDGQLPCNIDSPGEGETLGSLVTIHGWCQESGGRPCETVRIFIDGVERSPLRQERYPRPDVEAAVKGIGSCERAGFRAFYDFARDEAGEHHVTVFFLTADGRFRRMGPRRFFVGTSEKHR